MDQDTQDAAQTDPITPEGLRQLRILLDEGASGYTRQTVASLVADRDALAAKLSAATRTVAALATAPGPATLEDLLDATLAPHAVVTSHGGLHWHVTHSADCDRLPYGQECLFDLARELRGYEQEPPAAEMFVGTPFVQHDHGDGECGHDCPVLIRWSAAPGPTAPQEVPPIRGYRVGDLVEITGRGAEHDGHIAEGQIGYVAEIDDNPEYPIGLTVEGFVGLVWCSSGEIRHADAQAEVSAS